VAENNLEFNIKVFGGLNVSDQEDALVLRSHQLTQGGFSQVAPAESPSLKNIDFTRVGFQKRFGSTVDRDLTVTGDNVLVSGDVLVAGVEWQDSDSTDRYEVIASKKTIYISKNSAAYTQINTSTSGVYTHAADVTKAGFATTDGHLFIGLDGANQIQTFKRGTDLDEEMATGNTYEEAHSATTHTIEGTWPTGCYLIATIHSRLVFSDADVVLYYTPLAYTASSGIWKLGSAFFFTQGRILSLHSMSPEFSDSLKEILYIGTETGFEVLTGFDTTSDVVSRIEGSKAPLNHQSIAISKNWLCYLTNEKNIYGINKTSVIDLGRRFKNVAATGPLDALNLTASLTNAFGAYSDSAEQAYFFFSTSAVRFNDTCLTLDFKLGEPVPGEPQSGFERRVRCLDWQIKDPDDNDWFGHVFKSRGQMKGVHCKGKIWDFLSTDDDLDTHAVEATWKSPVFLGGAEALDKQFMLLVIRTLPKGSHSVTVNIYINRADGAELSYSFQQFQSGFGIWGTSLWGTGLWASTQLIKSSQDVDLYADAIQWEVKNFNNDEPFEAANMNLRYLIGAEER
jgi:hypothetical protein